MVKLIMKGSIEEDMLALGMTKLALDEAVAGEEGDERVEREMKTSLMNVVRRKLEDLKEDGDSEKEEKAQASKDSETKMDVDDDSSLSELE